MVTEQAKETAVPAEELAPLQSEVDEPLVPRGEPEGAEAQRPAVPEQPEPEARAEEEPEAPQKPEVAPEIEELVSARVREAESRIQSGYERRRREDEQTIRRLEAERESERSQRAVEERVEAHRRNLEQWYTQQGLDPSAVKPRIDQEVEGVRSTLLTQQQRANDALQMAALVRSASAVGVDSWVNKLAQDYSLGQDDVRMLRASYDPEQLPLVRDPNTGHILLDQPAVDRIGANLLRMAQRLGTASKVEAASKRAKRDSVRPVRLESAPGTPVQTDEQFLADFNAGRSNDLERAIKILRKEDLSPV